MCETTDFYHPQASFWGEGFYEESSKEYKGASGLLVTEVAEEYATEVAQRG